MSDIPQDLIADIFSRLPVKSILRFRCVSKHMCALIDSPIFIKSHLDQCLKSNSNRSMILGDEFTSLYTVDLDSFDKPVLLNHVIESLKPLNPKSHPYAIPHLLGSCNGLLCVLNSEDNIILSNPETRKYHKLPASKTKFHGIPGILDPDSFVFNNGGKITYGFGYNQVNHDYNVVKIVQPFGFGQLGITEVKVYSLKSNLWRRIKDFPYYICYKKRNAVFVSNALHWVVSLEGSDYFHPTESKEIASLDLGTEEVKLVPQPQYSGKNFQMIPAELGGSLFVACSYSRYTDFWVMKEYGVKESWTKLFSIAHSKDISHNLIPAAYSKSGDQALVQQGIGFLWYDLSSKSVKNSRISGMTEDFSEALVCMGSLVNPSGGGETDVTEEKREIKKKKKAWQKRVDFLSKGFKLAL